jgi:hypothetical protein
MTVWVLLYGSAGPSSIYDGAAFNDDDLESMAVVAVQVLFLYGGGMGPPPLWWRRVGPRSRPDEPRSGLYFFYF